MGSTSRRMREGEEWSLSTHSPGSLPSGLQGWRWPQLQVHTRSCPQPGCSQPSCVRLRGTAAPTATCPRKWHYSLCFPREDYHKKNFFFCPVLLKLSHLDFILFCLPYPQDCGQCKTYEDQSLGNTDPKKIPKCVWDPPRPPDIQRRVRDNEWCHLPPLHLLSCFFQVLFGCRKFNICYFFQSHRL